MPLERQCPICGVAYVNAKFCSECGAPLKGQPASAAVSPTFATPQTTARYADGSRSSTAGVSEPLPQHSSYSRWTNAARWTLLLPAALAASIAMQFVFPLLLLIALRINPGQVHPFLRALDPWGTQLVGTALAAWAFARTGTWVAPAQNRPTAALVLVRLAELMLIGGTLYFQYIVKPADLEPLWLWALAWAGIGGAWIAYRQTCGSWPRWT